jgi:hypothetical protein
MSKGNPFADLDALRTFGDGGEKEFMRCVQEMPGRPVRKPKRKDFTLLQLEWAAGAAKAARTPGAIVWILLHYMAWKTKSTTFPLSNMLLARYGVTRYTKYRILANLEKAGWIKTQRRKKHALLITLLVAPK